MTREILTYLESKPGQFVDSYELRSVLEINKSSLYSGIRRLKKCSFIEVREDPVAIRIIA